MASNIVFDPVALGLEGLGKFIEPASAIPTKGGTVKRAKKPKAAREEKVAAAPKLTPLETAAQAIADPEARELEGRWLCAGIAERKTKVIAERKALLERGPRNPERTAEIEARFADNPLSNECKQACNQIGKDYIFGLESLKRRIDELSTEQIEISHAYVKPEKLAGFEAMRPWFEAAIPIIRRRRVEAINARLDEVFGPWDAAGRAGTRAKAGQTAESTTARQGFSAAGAERATGKPASGRNDPCHVGGAASGLV